jgi:CDP-diacylglycerol--serine O-phosphatidyltransferase
MTELFQPLDPNEKKNPKKLKQRFKRVSLRFLLPNLVTLTALCAGLTAMRMAIENRLDMALIAIIFAAILDALDGRLARMLKSTSQFGAELDSLTDFVNFGVAPALILYTWALHDLRSFGWLAALIYTICAVLRLARFNIKRDDPEAQRYSIDYFEGAPTPAGAVVVLLPIYLYLLDIPLIQTTGPVVGVYAFYTMAIGLLMVSTLPTFSGKRVGMRIRRDWVLPILVMAVVFMGLLASYTWSVMAVGSLLYLACLPVSWQMCRRPAPIAGDN